MRRLMMRRSTVVLCVVAPVAFHLHLNRRRAAAPRWALLADCMFTNLAARLCLIALAVVEFTEQLQTARSGPLMTRRQVIRAAFV